MREVPGKNDAWPQDPWIEGRNSIRPDRTGAAFAFTFLSGAFTNGAVIDVVPNGDFIYVVGEVQAAGNGYSQGQPFVAVFNRAGIRVAMKTLRRPVAGVTRFGAFGCQPLPNGNIILASTVAATTAHVIISEINKNGDIVRGLYVRSSAYGNLVTGISKTKDPWVFVVTTYWYVFVLDARCMMMDSQSNGIVFVAGGMFSGGDVDRLTGMVPIQLNGSGNLTAFINSGEHIYQSILSYGTGMGVAWNNGSLRHPVVRHGDMLLFRDQTSGNQFVVIRDAFHGGGKSGRASRFTFQNSSEASQQGGDLAVCKDKIYAMSFNAAASGIVTVCEINPADMFFGGADGTAGAVTGKCRMLCFNIGSAQTMQDAHLTERDGLLCLKSQMGAGESPAFLFDFDTVSCTLAGSYGGVKNTGATAVFRDLYNPKTTGITVTMGECSYRAVTTNDVSVGFSSITPPGLATASMTATPLDPDGSTYYAVDAWIESVKIDVICNSFAIGGLQ